MIMNRINKLALLSVLNTLLVISGMAQMAQAQVSGVAPQTFWRETDQTLPAGLWRIQVNGDTFSIHKNTDATGAFGTVGSALTINPSQQVGIGVASASYKLDVQGAGNTQLFKFSTSSVGTGYLYGQLSTSNASLTTFVDSGSGASFLSGQTAAYSSGLYSAGGPLQMGTNNNVALTIDTSQRVGIGATPDEKLTVGGAIRVISNATSFGTQISGLIDYLTSTNTFRIVATAPSSSAGSSIALISMDTAGTAHTGLSINPTGKVSIGPIATPGPAMFYTSGLSTRAVFTISDSNTGSIMLAGGNTLPGVLASDVGLNIRTGASFITPDTGGVTVMQLTTGGLVGIGGVPGTYPLEVYGVNGLGIEYRDTTNGVNGFLGAFNSKLLLGTISNHDVSLYANNAEKARITTGGQVLFSDGGAAAPSVSYIGETTKGMYSEGSNLLGFATGGAERVRMAAGYVGIFGSTASVQFGDSLDILLGRTTANGLDMWVSGTDFYRFSFLGMQNATAYYSLGASIGSPDVFITRDAANVMALKNNTTAQAIRAYGSTANSSYTGIGHDASNGYVATSIGDLLLQATSNVVSLQRSTNPQALRVYGTTVGPQYVELGHTGGLAYLHNGTDTPFWFGVNNSNLWAIGVSSQSYSWTPLADNSYDLCLAADRCRSVNVGTSVNLGTSPAASGLLRFPDAGQVAYGATQAGTETVTAKTIPDNVATDLFEITTASIKYGGVMVTYSLFADGTDSQVETGQLNMEWSQLGATKASLVTKQNTVQQLSGSALTTTFATANTTGGIKVTLNGHSTSTGAANITIRYKIINLSDRALTIL